MIAKKLLPLLFLLPISAHASFIEATMGTAVVNDATAAYHNPAALTLLKNSQIVALGSYATLDTTFTGTSIQTRTGFSQSGKSVSDTHYHLPSLYAGIPLGNKFTIGIAYISNFFNNNLEGNSVLRYVKSGNSTHDYDVMPSIGYQFNESLSFGAGISYSHANLDMERIAGFPTLNVPDTESHNHCSGGGVTGDIGILIKPAKRTVVGLNYRGATTYKLSGKSELSGNPGLVSNHYGYTFFTPARTVLSINHFFTPKIGLIATTQFIQWSIIDTLHIHNIAAQVGRRALIVDVNTPHHMKNSWIFTLGGQYKPNTKWIFRAAGTFIESPGNPHYQIINGDSFVVGVSAGYKLNKHIQIDGALSHVFIQNADINITSNVNTITGVNKSSRDAVSLKLTYNI